MKGWHILPTGTLIAIALLVMSVLYPEAAWLALGSAVAILMTINAGIGLLLLLAWLNRTTSTNESETING